MSWSKLLVPMLLGQGVGVSVTGHFAWAGFLIALLITTMMVLFIVLLNDWADQRVDGIKRGMFPDGCSPKTIPDGILPAYRVLVVGLACGALAIGLGFAAGVALARPALGLVVVGCLLLFVLYSLPPVRLNYRGGGEVLEMVGVGGALPWMSSYVQSGVLFPLALGPVVLGFAPLALSSAIASGLADEESDRAGGKRTLVAWLGNRVGRRATEATALFGVAIWVFFGDLSAPRYALWVGAALVGSQMVGVMFRSSAAGTNAFAAQRNYKKWLHRSIALGGIGVGLVYAQAGA